MGLASRAALVAGVGGIGVGVTWGEVVVSITPYDHHPTKRSIPARQTKNTPRARPDWESGDFGELGAGVFMGCGFYLKILPVKQVDYIKPSVVGRTNRAIASKSVLCLFPRLRTGINPLLTCACGTVQAVHGSPSGWQILAPQGFPRAQKRL